MSSEAVHPPESPPPPPARKRPTATHFFLKGLAISLPPVLTLVILIWIGGGIYEYVIQPISRVVQFTIAQFIDNSLPNDYLTRWSRLPPLDYVGTDYLVRPSLQDQLEERLARSPEPVAGPVPREWLDLGQVYVPMGTKAVPYPDFAVVARQLRPSDMPSTPTGIYMEVVTVRYFRSLLNLSSVAVILAIIGVYFIGRFVTVRIGAWIVYKGESWFLNRVPFVRNVYSSVKQVTDFVLSERQVEYSRVVIIEYPRRGIWSIGFVTGEAMFEVSTAAGEPCVSVLIPSSPMPITGYTIQIPRSQVHDLNLTIDQAFQFCLSCGVLIPPQQKTTVERLQQELTRRLAGERSIIIPNGERPKTEEGTK